MTLWVQTLMRLVIKQDLEPFYYFRISNYKICLCLLKINKWYNQMIGASDEQVDVFNEVWYTVLINAGETSKGLKSSQLAKLNNLLFCLPLYLCQQLIQFQWFAAIEILGKQIRKREGAPFLWRLLVRVLTQSHCFLSFLVFTLEFVRQDCYGYTL